MALSEIQKQIARLESEAHAARDIVTLSALRRAIARLRRQLSDRTLVLSGDAS